MATGKKRRFSKDLLYLRGRVWWTRLPTKGRVPTPIKDPSAAGRELARQWRLEQLRQIADPLYARTQATTVGKMIADALDAHRVRKGRVSARVTEKTMRYYREKLGHFSTYFGLDCPLSDLDYDRIGGYIKKREADPGAAHDTTLSPSTIGKELKELRFALRIQRGKGVYHHDVDFVTRKGEYGDEGKECTRALPQDEIIALICAFADWGHKAGRLNAKQEAHKTMRCQQVAWHFATGVRGSESGLAEMSDHKKVNGRWRVLIRGTKSRKARSVIPIAPGFFTRLLEFSLYGRPKTGKLFKPWNPSNFNRALKRAAARAGIERLSTNDIRRSGSTLLSDAGIPNEVLKHVFRHTTTAMLDKRYVKKTISATEDALTLVTWPEE